jgi:hypothetical protein
MNKLFQIAWAIVSIISWGHKNKEFVFVSREWF